MRLLPLSSRSDPDEVMTSQPEDPSLDPVRIKALELRRICAERVNNDEIDNSTEDFFDPDYPEVDADNVYRISPESGILCGNK
jgi:hypothetical protein